jgi:putative ABC transport system ATP-binding protein
MYNTSDRELACERASLAYTDGNRTNYALRDVSVILPPGQFVGIMGPSGSGKSSLLYVLAGLKPPTEGSARFGGIAYRQRPARDVAKLRRERFGFVFQQPFLLPYLTAAENVLVAAVKQNSAARERAQALLGELGLEEGQGSKMPPQLSGGEKQRVAVARAMMNDPDVIFADEPTAALDHANGHRVVDALARWREKGTIVVVTHDPEMVADADTVLYLRDGALAEVRKRAVATSAPERLPVSR